MITKIQPEYCTRVIYDRRVERERERVGQTLTLRPAAGNKPLSDRDGLRKKATERVMVLLYSANDGINKMY